MGKLKLKGVKLKLSQKTKGAWPDEKVIGERMQVLETAWVDKSPPCKSCRTRPRKTGSSRCEVCSLANNAFKIGEDRLAAKISKQQ